MIPLSTTDIHRTATSTISILVDQASCVTQTFQLGDGICFKGGKHVLHLFLTLKSAVPQSVPRIKLLIDDLLHFGEMHIEYL